MKDEPSEETLNRWHNDPDNWTWGIIYHNKHDKRIIVPKKIRWMGMTLNFAHPEAYWWMGLILLLPVIILIVTFVYK
jgi:uncharacterized membrane protein